MTWGIDYASVDGNRAPDLDKLKAAGCAFVWLRATYDCRVDPTFVRDFGALARAGLIRGAYGFPLPGGKHSPTEFAQALYATCDAAGGLRPGVDFPPCIDVEFPHGIAGTGLTRAQIMEWIRAAIFELRRLFKVWPVIYTSGRVWNDNDTDCLGAPPAPDLTSCPLWLARYALATRLPARIPPAVVDRLRVPLPWGDQWCAHQCQGDALGVPGLSATADVDRFRSAKFGDAGGHVAYAQRKLGLLQDDGKLGPITSNALKVWQGVHGLDVSGALDVETFCSLAWL